jgi:hypothetical protein
LKVRVPVSKGQEVTCTEIVPASVVRYLVVPDCLVSRHWNETQRDNPGGRDNTIEGLEEGASVETRNQTTRLSVWITRKLKGSSSPSLT